MSTEDLPTGPEPETPVPTAGSIVVGHDGSPGGVAALIKALEFAQECGAPVVVVRTWSITTAPRPENWRFGYVSSFDDYAAAVCAKLERDVESIVAKFDEVQVTYHAPHGAAAKKLVALSTEAKMLVVGTRGHSVLTGMLLGSVSEECLHHATCPVLVVHPVPKDHPHHTA